MGLELGVVVVVVVLVTGLLELVEVEVVGGLFSPGTMAFSGPSSMSLASRRSLAMCSFRALGVAPVGRRGEGGLVWVVGRRKRGRVVGWEKGEEKGEGA